MRVSKPLRVVLYSHDALGLGHLRRNLLIAQTLAQSPLAANVLLITGTSTANRFTPPPNVDFLTLPALSKQHDGRYESRSFAMSAQDVIALRAKTILAAVQSFAPNLLIVDNVPRGVGNELDETLLYLRTRADTAVVLGLRDILDDPATVETEWSARANYEWIRNCFDQVWVYGDQRFFDPVVEYNWSNELASKILFTGYLDRRETSSADYEGNSLTRSIQRIQSRGARVVLCMVGGGQDGAVLADTFSRIELPAHHYAVLLTGPFMPGVVKARLRTRLERRPDWKMATFHSNPVSLLPYADAVIAMGGYNTVSELLSHETPTLIVPRVVPRREQWIRADRLRQCGLIDVLESEHLTPESISRWLPLAARASPGARDVLDFNGLARLPQLVASLCHPLRARKWG
jgi:predicted glycosyltransferase